MVVGVGSVDRWDKEMKKRGYRLAEGIALTAGAAG
jgi:hypothetical protein